MFKFFRTKITLFVNLAEHDVIEAWATEKKVSIHHDLVVTRGDMGPNFLRWTAKRKRVKCRYKLRDKDTSLFMLMWSEHLYTGQDIEHVR